MSKSGLLCGVVVASKWKLNKRIGGGSFGEVYSGEHLRTKEQVAVKVENLRVRHPQLIYEARLLKYLKGEAHVFASSEGILLIHHCCTHDDNHFMVTELLGDSLEMHFQQKKKFFSMECTLLIGIELLQRVKYLHSKSFLHRDIKPDNFLSGGNKKIIYMIDLGLAKKYRDIKTHKHIPYLDSKNLTGTARYASINTHLGVEQSRRDDLESVAYVLLYFLKNGNLPWQGLKGDDKKEKYKKILDKKMSTPIDVLCHKLPEEFSAYLYYCRSLKFEEEPNYQYLINLLRSLLSTVKNRRNVFDWIVPTKESSYYQGQQDKFPISVRTSSIEIHSNNRPISRYEKQNKVEEKRNEDRRDGDRRRDERRGGREPSVMKSSAYREERIMDGRKWEERGEKKQANRDYDQRDLMRKKPTHTANTSSNFDSNSITSPPPMSKSQRKASTRGNSTGIAQYKMQRTEKNPLPYYGSDKYEKNTTYGSGQLKDMRGGFMGTKNYMGGTISSNGNNSLATSNNKRGGNDSSTAKNGYGQSSIQNLRSNLPVSPTRTLQESRGSRKDDLGDHWRPGRGEGRERNEGKDRRDYKKPEVRREWEKETNEPNQYRKTSKKNCEWDKGNYYSSECSSLISPQKKNYTTQNYLEKEKRKVLSSAPSARRKTRGGVYASKRKEAFQTSSSASDSSHVPSPSETSSFSSRRSQFSPPLRLNNTAPANNPSHNVTSPIDRTKQIRNNYYENLRRLNERRKHAYISSPHKNSGHSGGKKGFFYSLGQWCGCK